MVSYEQFVNTLNEGVYDKNIFNAVILAGGPGSGKSYVTNKVTTGMNLKMINSDEQFERALKKVNMSFNINSMTPDEYEKAMEIRNKSKKLTELKMELALRGRLGLVIDGTGRDYEKIKKQVEMLRNLGYRCSMIMVNVPLEVSLERNKQRERSVPENIVTQSWQDVQNNIGKFQNLFGISNFIVVDNTNATENILTKVRKQVMRILDRPVMNSVAKQWIDNEMEIKKRK